MASDEDDARTLRELARIAAPPVLLALFTILFLAFGLAYFLG